jgi:hypothetical protein
VLEVAPGDIDQNTLTEAQRDAPEGRFAAALAGFIQWLAPRLDEARAELRTSVREWREHPLSHKRSSDILGHLAGAWRLFLSFATETGAVTTVEGEQLELRVREALVEAGHAQVEQQRSADPVERFRQLLAGALVSGDAHIADAETQNEPAEPADPAAWGWQARTEQLGQSETKTWLPLGARIGWVRGDDLFLESEAAFAAVQRLASRQGTSLGVSARTLWKRMEERNLLVSRSEGRSTTRTQIGGSRRRVVHLGAAFLSTEDGVPGPAVQKAGSSFGPGHNPKWGTNLASEEPETAEEGVRSPGAPNAPLAPLMGEDTRKTREHWRRLEIRPVDGVTAWVLESDVRRWQLRRGDDVLAETQPDDHETARLWFACLRSGEVPGSSRTETTTPRPEPVRDPETQQFDLTEEGAL